jgi:hypothetical protein
MCHWPKTAIVTLETSPISIYTFGGFGHSHFWNRVISLVDILDTCPTQPYFEDDVWKTPAFGCFQLPLMMLRFSVLGIDQLVETFAIQGCQQIVIACQRAATPFSWISEVKQLVAVHNEATDHQQVCWGGLTNEWVASSTITNIFVVAIVCHYHIIFNLLRSISSQILQHIEGTQSL